MESQSYAISKACYYHIRNIHSIRRYDKSGVYKTLAHAFVTSSLDYGNTLLYGLLSTLTTGLERVQNSAARLVTRTLKREHIIQVLNSLHWLLVIQRSKYKIMVYQKGRSNALEQPSISYREA